MTMWQGYVYADPADPQRPTGWIRMFTETEQSIYGMGALVDVGHVGYVYVQVGPPVSGQPAPGVNPVTVLWSGMSSNTFWMAMGTLTEQDGFRTLRFRSPHGVDVRAVMSADT